MAVTPIHSSKKRLAVQTVFLPASPEVQHSPAPYSPALQSPEVEIQSPPVTPVRSRPRVDSPRSAVRKTDQVAAASTPISAKRVREKGESKMELSAESDLAKLSHLTVDDMCASLQQRFAKDQIYTWCGSVLISVNPYRPIASLYGAQQVQQYHSHSVDIQLPPHLFAVGRRLLRTAATMRNQSVVISGESGAGKTEATNILVGFLSAANSGAPAALHSRLLASSVVLESLGNAKTEKNDNSSRFGKLLKLHFGDDGLRMRGATVEAYMLEETRVTGPANGERNFHVFYQMCAGASAEEKTQLKLQSTGNFAVLKQCTNLPSRNDAREWGRFKDALIELGIGKDVQLEAFRLFAAVLHLGNICFEESVSRAGIKQVELARDSVSLNSLTNAAELLGLEISQLRNCLTQRIIRASARDSVVVKSLSLIQAKEGRDSLMREIYGRLFNYFLALINEAISPKSDDEKKGGVFVGILDLFGFENFESGNHFEQLMINYANEKMHEEFLSEVILQELREYAEEGVPAPEILELPKAGECVELFEDRTRGIIAILDDECRVENGSAQSFFAKLAREWLGKKCVSVPKVLAANNRNIFTVNHYAECVAYSTHLFRSRNQRVLRQDLFDTVAQNSRPLLRSIFAEIGSGKVSVGRKFKSSLSELSEMIRNSSVSWIKCVKPNWNQMANMFEFEFVAKQLNYLGMVAVAKLRQIGFPLRLNFSDMVARYSGEKNNFSGDRECAIALIERACPRSATLYRAGEKKMFLSQIVWDKLEEMREEEQEKKKKMLLEQQEKKKQRTIVVVPEAVPEVVPEVPKGPEVVIMTQVAASLQGSLEGANLIMRNICDRNCEWLAKVMTGLRELNSALSTLRFGKYSDVASPEQFDSVSGAGKKSTLRRTLRKQQRGEGEENNYDQPREKKELEELTAMQREKKELEMQVTNLRMVRAEKSQDKKKMEFELEQIGRELEQKKRELSEQNNLLLEQEEGGGKKSKLEISAKKKEDDEIAQREKKTQFEMREEKKKKWAEKQAQLMQEKIIEEEKKREIMIRRIQEMHALEEEKNNSNFGGKKNAEISNDEEQKLYGFDLELSEKIKKKK